MTLAHELGHGVHQALVAPNGALMADPLTLAETASVRGDADFQEIAYATGDKKSAKGDARRQG
jgi:oligoendopeptidase F